MSPPGGPEGEQRSAQQECTPVGLDRCPGCRARLAERSACPRCGCDLTLVRRTEAEARRLLCSALDACAAGDRGAAAAHAAASCALVHSALARILQRRMSWPPVGPGVRP